MSAYAESASTVQAQLALRQRWLEGWRRPAVGAIILVYLLYVADAITNYSHGSDAVIGEAVLAAFAACWVGVLALSRQAISARFWVLYCVLVGLFLAELPFAHAQAFVMGVFIALVAVPVLGRWSAPLVAALALGALLLPPAIPSWHVSFDGALDDVTPVAIPIAALMAYTATQVIRSSEALAKARAELALLAAENERIRIARDLHDLLGHSLTTITVKAGLACRLGATDPVLGLREMAEVETLARQTLTDVRAAVGNYRDVTLTGELAAGRELLRAAGIAADLPHAVDVVDPAHRELFGWVVREGLTNVVRHAHASTCAVRLSASSVEIVDDGVGGTAAPGNGLYGLRERVAAAGGVVDSGPLEPHGWRLLVSLATCAAA